MMSAITSIRSLLLAIFALMAGAGFLATLVSIRLDAAGASAMTIGLVSTCYFVGLTVGALRVGAIIQRVGHIRMFAAVVSVLSASTLVYALHRDPWLWAGLRLLDGLCIAGVFVCLESWLNERAEPADRGMVLAAYMIALYAGQGLGQLLLNLSDAKPSIPFVVASILISLAAVPVCLTRIPGPSMERAEPLGVLRLFAISPLGAVGAVVTGLMIGAFYGLGAVFVRRLGLSLAETSGFMTIVILGGVALQWPLGRLSDRWDRRKVIVFSFAGTLAASLAIAFAREGPWLLGLGALFGGLSFALYPLCVAHTNDHLQANQRVAASGGLVLLYSIGAALGPTLAAGLMTLLGPAGLFGFIAACAGGALVFGFWRQASSEPVPPHAQQTYQILPRTTPMSAVLDPAADADASHPTEV